MPDINSPGSDSKLKIDLVKAALLKRSDLPYYVTGCKVPVVRCVVFVGNFGDASNLTGLVLGCIETKFCK